MAEKLSKEWFELQAIRKRHFAQEEWVPVYVNEKFEEEEFSKIGYIGEYFSLRSVVIFNNKRGIYMHGREQGGEYHVTDEWMNFARILEAQPCFSENNTYIDSSSYVSEDGKIRLGLKLVISPDLYKVWESDLLVQQDFILAYHLLRKGDMWYEPSYEEGEPSQGTEVIRQKCVDGKLTKIEINRGYLRDYLAAHNAALRICYFVEHDAILQAKPDFINEVKRHNPLCEENKADRQFDLWCRSQYEIWHNCKKEESGFYVEGRLWCREWLEWEQDTRLKNEDAPVPFIIIKRGKSGAPERTELKYSYAENGRDDQDCLWFSPDIINKAILRGGRLKWHERDGGYIESHGYNIFFAINELGLLNVCCWDIERLPIWQKRFWCAENIPPQGEMAGLFLPSYPDYERHFISDAKQFGYEERAPEVRLLTALKRCGIFFAMKFGWLSLFKEDEKRLAGKLHRFRAIDEAGFNSLVKDLEIYTIDRLNADSLTDALKLSGAAIKDKEEQN